MLKILWEFEIQMDQLILSRIPDPVIIKKKKNLSYHGLCLLARKQGENQRKRKERQVFGPFLRTKNVMEYESKGDISYNWYV